MQRWSLAPSAAALMLFASLFAAGTASAGQKPKEWDPVIDPANFVGAVTNPYFPLAPGRTLSYRGDTKSGVETLEIEVRHQHKTILGVATTVVIETAALNGDVIEIAENWFAQDLDGNVWYFGEATQDFDHGVPGSTAGSWEAGVSGAKPGIIMEANPQVGDTYFQEFAEGVAQDMASVSSTDLTVTVPLRTFDHVLRTKEWTPLEGNSVEHKYYAPGIGLIKEEKGSEELTLIAVD
jgi:hypothetical protein